MKKIVLISTGQPTLNPRLIKEAITLQRKGFQVIILYQHWSNWAIKSDEKILATHNLKAKLVGGNPEVNKMIYWFTRILFKLSKKVAPFIKYNFGFAELAIARSTWLLIRKAKKIKADLYIAHNLGALPAAVIASKFHKSLSGFDAEDFHRFEVSNNVIGYETKVNSFIEEKYLPSVNYITASSPLISKAYESIFNKTFEVILNVFDRTTNRSLEKKHQYLKLFWFSQTIGPNRGLENVIDALNISRNGFELHLLGEITSEYKISLCNALQTSSSSLHFYEPISPDEIFDFATKFDIGLATEPGFSLNNNYALSNKIFTYIQSGLATIASNTPAQSQLLNKYPGIGKLFTDKNHKDLASILDIYYKDRSLLVSHKATAYRLGQDQLNWEVESKKFIEIINKTLNS